MDSLFKIAKKEKRKRNNTVSFNERMVKQTVVHSYFSAINRNELLVLTLG